MGQPLNLPLVYQQRMKEILGEKYYEYESSLMNIPPIKGLQVNLHKISAEKFMTISPFKIKRIDDIPEAFYLYDDKIGNHPYHHAGMFYIQEPSAMLPVNTVDINPNWMVLDMCAAPGGKTIQLANKLTNGTLVSNEIIYKRAQILLGNIERMGLPNVIVTSFAPNEIAELYSETFDLVLVDAPCSGEGMFRKNPEAISEWSLYNIEKCVERQKEILKAASSVVKNGGYIIYSTCTFSLDENESMISDFIKNNSNFKLVKVTERVEKYTSNGITEFHGDEMKKTRRVYPHNNFGEGQFMCVLQKCDGMPASSNINFKNSTIRPLNRNENRILQEFLMANTVDLKIEPYMHNENIVAVPCLPSYIPNRNVLSCGVKIGEIKNKVLRPHHQFFMAYGNYFKNKVELDLENEKLYKYLSGDTIEQNINDGWGVITTKNVPVGGFKAVKGVLKNHYPKGLRQG